MSVRTICIDRRNIYPINSVLGMKPRIAFIVLPTRIAEEVRCVPLRQPQSNQIQAYDTDNLPEMSNLIHKLSY